MIVRVNKGPLRPALNKEGYPTNNAFSQKSEKEKRQYQKGLLRYQDPIWMLTKNPLFVGKVNTLIIGAREKWNSLEREKMYNNPFYKPQACPVTRDAVTWLSAYLKYYFMTDVDDTDIDRAGLSDLERIFNILLHNPEGADEPDYEAEVLEGLIY